MAGLTSAGFIAKTQAEIEADTREDIANSTALGGNINTAAESPLGQIVVIASAMLTELWGEAENVNTASSLLNAAGVNLANRALEFGLSPHPAESSTVGIDITGDATTVLPSTAALTDPEGNRWVIQSSITIGSLGTGSATFVAENTGATAALAGTTWTIATPVSGWTTNTNPLDAVLGRDAETDAALRGRSLSAAQKGTASGIDGIRARVLAVTNVTECVVIENDTNATDADGRAPKSIEAVVRGGADADVLAAIWTKPAGIETVTTVAAPNQISGTVTDASGTAQTVTGSRPDEIPIYVEVDYTPLAVAPISVEATIQQTILDFGESLTLDATGVYPPNVESAIFRAFDGSVFSHFVLRMGLTASPVGAATVPTSRTEIAVFDSSRILIAKV